MGQEPPLSPLRRRSPPTTHLRSCKTRGGGLDKKKRKEACCPPVPTGRLHRGEGSARDMAANCGEFAGLKRFDCRSAIMKKLDALGLGRGKAPNPMPGPPPLPPRHREFLPHLPPTTPREFVSLGSFSWGLLVMGSCWGFRDLSWVFLCKFSYGKLSGVPFGPKSPPPGGEHVVVEGV